MNFEPLASRLRPLTLQDFVGQEHILGEGAHLRKIVESGRWHSLLFWGPPGVGKTTLARIASVSCGAPMVELSAVSCGVKELREAIQVSSEQLRLGKSRSIVFVDEIHRLNKSQQDVLLPAIEKGIIGFIGATSENPSFEVNPAILSRTLTFRLDPLSSKAMADLLSRAASAQNCAIEQGGMDLLIQMAQGDARRGLNVLEVCLAALIASDRDIQRFSAERQQNRQQNRQQISQTINQPINQEFSQAHDDVPSSLKTRFSSDGAGGQPSFCFFSNAPVETLSGKDQKPMRDALRRNLPEVSSDNPQPPLGLNFDHDVTPHRLSSDKIRLQHLALDEGFNQQVLMNPDIALRKSDQTEFDANELLPAVSDHDSVTEGILRKHQTAIQFEQASCPASLLNPVKSEARYLTAEYIKNLGLDIPLGHGEHYDLASAMIKSLRASHPDAGLYYMARLIEQGDDPMFIARRLVIFASEDVGNANPEALQIAASGASACQLVGFPEARIILSQVVTYLAASPKSNRAYRAVGEALECVRKTGKLAIPSHLLNPVTSFNKQLGLGKGYDYPHDDHSSYRTQSYLPPSLKGKKFYEPSEIGTEKLFKKNLDVLRPTGDD